MKKIYSTLAAIGAVALPVIAMALSSGLNKGEYVSAYHPQHVTGPNKGTDACPPCTYGNRPMVQMWVNGDSMDNVKAAAKILNQRVVAEKNKKQLKGFIIFVTEKSKIEELKKTLEKSAKDWNTNDIALAYLDKNDEAVSKYKVNTSSEVKNTIFVYVNRQVENKYVNLKLDKEGSAHLNKAIDVVLK